MKKYKIRIYSGLLAKEGKDNPDITAIASDYKHEDGKLQIIGWESNEELVIMDSQIAFYKVKKIEVDDA